MKNPKYLLLFLLFYLFIGSFIIFKIVCPSSGVTNADLSADDNSGLGIEAVNYVDQIEYVPQDKSIAQVVIDEKDDLEIAVPKQEQKISEISESNSFSSRSKTIIVKPGECLSKIAARHYDSSMMFQKIFEANRDVLSSPHKIFPGQVLTLP